jgi:hypothetical protein
LHHSISCHQNILGHRAANIELAQPPKSTSGDVADALSLKSSDCAAIERSKRECGSEAI